MGFQDPPLYILLCDHDGWRSSDKFVTQQQQTVLVHKGSFLQVDNYHCFDPGRSVSVTLSCLDKPGVKLTVLIKNMSPITRLQYQLLRNVDKPGRRLDIVSDKHHLDLQLGNTVLYSPPRDPLNPVLARVSYMGRVAEMARDGFLLGLEVTEPGWAQGGGGRSYFDTREGRGVFCDIGCVRPVRDNCEVIETNNNINTPVLNILLSEKKNNASSLQSRNLQTTNNLRMIHNDLQGLYSQNAESEVETKEKQRSISPRPFHEPTPSPRVVRPVKVVRPTLSRDARIRKDSDNFSWDPNSRRTSSRASNTKMQDPVRRSPQTNEGLSSSIPNFDEFDPCLKHRYQDYESDREDRETPPPHQFLAPRDQDESGLTWSQRLSASVARSSPPQSLEEENKRPPPSPSPPPEEFIKLRDESGVVDVAVGSMVQLETVTGDKMCGVVRYCGDIPPRPGAWVGVEMEEEVRGGYNGWVENRQLFTCAPGKGVFVPYTHVIPDPRFKESLPAPVIGQQDFGPIDSPLIPGFCPPHPAVDQLISICGRNKGIQGHQNSCYLDATLFSMFTFTSVFDSLLYRPRGPGDISRYEEVQTVLKEEIVNPLRQSLFVRADKVMKLRTMLDSLSDVKGLTDQEKDPEEFLSSLLSQVMKVEPFLELSSGQTSHNYQILVEKDPNMVVPTVQELFDQSFATSSCSVKFKRAPSALILQLPRFGRQFKLYDKILPSQLLDVTDVIMSSPRQCVICGVLAEWECPQCYGSHLSGLASTAYCGQCLQVTHQHKQRRNHKQERLETPAGWSKQSQQPIPRILMDLVAVICIETSHYVSFVRCGDSAQSPWCFFDSMADRRGEQNGYNIPEMIPAKEIERLMSEQFAEEMKKNPNIALGDQAKRLVSDAYMCIYQSSQVKMYR